MKRNDEQQELLQEQIERRRKRGLEELTKIVNRGRHPVYSTFEVASVSERAYTVQIRSLTDVRSSHLGAVTSPPPLRSRPRGRLSAR